MCTVPKRTSKALRIELPTLIEPAGPPAHERDFQCIVVSQETAKGGEAINQLRTRNSLPPLLVHTACQGMLLADNDANETLNENHQVSSTNLRTRRLGELIRPPFLHARRNYSFNPYVIGLTGGSCTGKSTIGRQLAELGDGAVTVIDCDKLGHLTYQQVDGPCWRDLVQAFGLGIVNDRDRSIDRAKLGQIVFANSQQQLPRLNKLVWPHIRQMAIDELATSTAAVAVLDAAVLLDAGWQDMCDEVWVTFVPRDEQLKRIVARDNKTHLEAEMRLASQMDSQTMIARANVALSTDWSHEATAQQVQNAFVKLQARMRRVHTSNTARCRL
eukprot:TRINITY_DN22347_c0_g2_i1.p1 TRINITY_DN22347_c0_g2~~TRINITY_DN22347_c0_g2_i1.p1  ORF type:complete len:330 (+),score=30.20 TRINITY_DN22347_c0_g2_i1:142-1131(+)